MDDKNYLKHLDNLYKNKKEIAKYELLYRRKYPDLIYINGLPIHFDSSFDKILISLSGGADSAILAYMLLDYIKTNKIATKVHFFSAVRFWNSKPWLERNAQEVASYLKEKFGDIIAEHHWGFVPTELEDVYVSQLNKPFLEKIYPKYSKCDTICVNEYEHFLMKKHKIDFMYTGTTMNPPLNTEDQPKFRDEELIKDNIEWVLSLNNCNPFGLVRKSFTMAQYKNYDLDDLLSLTRSCEADIVKLGNMWIKNGLMPPVCGDCFFCQERQWGIDNSEGFLLENL